MLQPETITAAQQKWPGSSTYTCGFITPYQDQMPLGRTELDTAIDNLTGRLVYSSSKYT